jgi:Rrf2 family transcriptional regulator, iron-sulfur cluster assembly transcription factor
MILSKATGYGILALAYLAIQPKNRRCGLEEIALHEQIPPVFLRKVLGELRRHRLLRSVKGIHGGYELNRPPDTITLWDVVHSLEPEPDFDACVLGRGSCHSEVPCPFHGDWQKVREAWITLLQTKTILGVGEESQLLVAARSAIGEEGDRRHES